MTRFNASACDMCDGATYSDENPRVFYRTQRPSCHQEMCCTIAGHMKCLGVHDVAKLPQINETSGIATGDQWETWIESKEARKAGYLWIT